MKRRIGEMIHLKQAEPQPLLDVIFESGTGRSIDMSGLTAQRADGLTGIPARLRSYPD